MGVTSNCSERTAQRTFVVLCSQVGALGYQFNDLNGSCRESILSVVTRSPSGAVFARMQPDQKAQLIEALQEMVLAIELTDTRAALLSCAAMVPTTVQLCALPMWAWRSPKQPLPSLRHSRAAPWISGLLMQCSHAFFLCPPTLCIVPHSSCVPEIIKEGRAALATAFRSVLDGQKNT